MNKTEERKIEKALIEKINELEVGTEAHSKALKELLEFQKQQEEIRKNQEDERLLGEKQSEEARKNLENEMIDKEKNRIEKDKLAQEDCIAQENAAIEKNKLDLQKKIERQSRINNILCAILSIFGGIATTIVGYKLFDKQATKAYKFEETGVVSSFTSKQVLSGLKPPKR